MGGEAQAGSLCHQDAVPEWALKLALKRADLVRLFAAAVRGGEAGRVGMVKADFLQTYNLGAWAQLYAELGAVSLATLERWAKAMRKSGDPLDLAPKWGEHRRERRHVIKLPGGLEHRYSHDVSEAEAVKLLAEALNPNARPIAEAVRVARVTMAADGIRAVRSEATHKRFLEDFRDRNYGVWVGCREGEKAVNDKVSPYLVRDMGQMAVGDAAVADGHTFNFEILSPWTGKPQRMTLVMFYDMFSKMPLGWEIMPTENTQAIAVAMRRAILMLGKIPLCAYLDNGKAFRARYFNGTPDLRQCGIDGLFARLEMERIYAWPYHGESKVVERFFGVLKEFERTMPSYVGDSIQNKPPRMRMGEKWHRRMYAKITGGCVPDLFQVHGALARFFEEYALRVQKNGHLKGLKPWDVFAAGQGPGVDPAGLQELMMTEVIKKPGRNGVYLPGLDHYYHRKLTGIRHPLMIRYDRLEPDFILVYETTGEFICRAEPWGKTHALARITGTEADREELSGKIGEKLGVMKESMSVVRAVCNDLVIPETRKMLERQGLAGGDARPYGTGPGKENLLRLPSAEDFDRQVAESEGRQAAAAAQEAAGFWRRLRDLPERERFERLLELEVQGRALPGEDLAFMRYFEKTETYQELGEYYEERRLIFSLGGG